MPNLIFKLINKMSEDNQKALFLLIYCTIPLWIIFLYNGNEALFKGETINIDLDILILKNSFVKFLIVCLDLIFIYLIYCYLENKISKFKMEYKRKQAMEKLVKKYPHCLFWVDEMRKNKFWGGTRFKKIEKGYPDFVMYPSLYDVESLESFTTPEIGRLPLFIGSQFGIQPKLEEVFKSYDTNIKIAILNKSLLSGSVAGLKIYSLKRNYELEEIIYFKNIK